MKEFLDNAANLYYKGSPILSDEEFDRLADAFGYNKVGHKITDGIPHYFPMYSLQKYFSLEDAGPLVPEYISSPKLDGAAVSILYVSGQYTLGLTRGDGKMGRDITDKLAHLVPDSIGLDGIVQITGEVVAPASIPNARNYASGALNLKDMEEFVERDIDFVAYDITPTPFVYLRSSFVGLRRMGFTTVIDVGYSLYPTDGIVYRINDNEKFAELGYTAHHPRGAFALKEQKSGVVTKLIDVKWQVGKSGVVSPVGILDPVKIGDATVARATLHNIEYIRSLNLEIGCQVEVIRSGEIIPRILRRVDD